MPVERGIVFPLIYQQHGLRILHRKKVVVSPVSFFVSDFFHSSTCKHLFGEFFCRSIFSCKLVADTLKLAYKKNKINGTILHSDQGSTYTTGLYYNLTKEFGITPSMSRKATPLDNAPAESFFSAFKTECVYLETKNNKGGERIMR